MNLLLVNFVTDRDSPVLAYQCEVIDVLARHCSKVVVLTSRLGRYEPPANVIVEVIPVRPFGVPQRLGGVLLVNLQAWRICRRHAIDRVFIHMAKDWAVFLAPVFLALRLPVSLWYAHGALPMMLRLAAMFCDTIVTASPDSCRLASPKVRVIGHSIPTALFKPAPRLRNRDILCVGRISRVKRIELLLSVVQALREAGHADFRVRIIGSPLTAEDHLYMEELKLFIRRKELQNLVELKGPLTYQNMPEWYQCSLLLVNFSRTNSIDKVVLEAMACGCPVLTSNPAFAAMLKEHPEFYSESDDPQVLSRRVQPFLDGERQINPFLLSSMVQDRHDLESYPARLFAAMGS